MAKSAAIHQLAPGAGGSHPAMLVLPTFEEHAPIQDLYKDGPADAQGGLAQVGGRRHRLPPQRPLLHVPRGRPTKDLLFALEELEESQICLWAAVYDGAGLRREGIGEFLRALSEEREATLVPRLDCDGLEGRPCHPSQRYVARDLYCKPEALRAASQVRQARWGRHRRRT